MAKYKSVFWKPGMQATTMLNIHSECIMHRRISQEIPQLNCTYVLGDACVPFYFLLT